MIVWSDREVEVSELRPYERNPRRISKESYSRLKTSLQTLGYHQRIIAQPDLRVIGGHQRIRALQELGVSRVKILVPDRELSTAEFRQLLIQDNLPFGDFDMEMLSNDFDVDELMEWGMPPSWMGALPKPKHEGLTDEEETPPTPADPITRLGDVWICGNHRIMSGDSTQALHVEQLLNGVKPHLMVTDPPYRVEYDANWRNEAARSSTSGMGNRALGAGALGKVLNDDKADWREAWALFPGNIAYVWHAGLHAQTVAESLISTGFKLRSQIIWAKNHFAIGRGDYHWQHEPCWYAVRGTGNWTGDRKQATLWQIDKPARSETGHSTQKPVECMRRPLENNSSPGQAIYEPFSGSGTTLLACEQTDRHCYAMELNPAYVDVAVKRWQDYTGKQAIREADKCCFNATQINQ